MKRITDKYNRSYKGKVLEGVIDDNKKMFYIGMRRSLDFRFNDWNNIKTNCLNYSAQLKKDIDFFNDLIEKGYIVSNGVYHDSKTKDSLKVYRINGQYVKGKNLKDAIKKLKDAWSGRYNNAIYNYTRGVFEITYNNGEIEKVPGNKIKTIEDLHRHIDKHNLKDAKDDDRIVNAEVDMVSSIKSDDKDRVEDYIRRKYSGKYPGLKFKCVKVNGYGGWPLFDIEGKKKDVLQWLRKEYHVNKSDADLYIYNL